MILLVCLIVSCYTAVVASSESKYPEGALPCKMHSTTILDCSFRKLFSIPLLDYNEAKTLDMSNNNLMSIHATDFIHLYSLEKLDLSGNNIKIVDGRDFIHLDSLQHLHLSYNKLKAISFATQWCLHDLDLSHNSIRKISHPMVFDGLHNLQALDISCNNLYLLSDFIFKNLTHLQFLDISHNRLVDIPDILFSSLFHLQYLDISSNKITDFPHGVFRNFTYLEHLNISYNSFKYLNNFIFSELTNLRDVDLSHTSLSNVNVGNFKKLKSLVNLTISFESISRGYLDSTSFMSNDPPFNRLTLTIDSSSTVLNATSLQPITNQNSSLQYFHIRCDARQQENTFSIEAAAFSMFPALRELSISDCASLQISDNAFQNLKQLKSLSLPRNGIAEVPYKALSTLLNFTQLLSLDLSSNKIETIALNKYSGRLKSLTLTGNPLRDVNARILGKNVLSELYLDGLVCDATNVKNTPSSLTTLYLSSDQKYKQHFDIAPRLCDIYSKKLQHIYMMNILLLDSVSKVLGTRCSRLLTLHITGLQLHEKQYNVHLPQLESLTMSNCGLISVQQIGFLKVPPLKSLDLSNNNIESIGNSDISFIANLTRLTYLNLTGNRIASLSFFKSLHAIQTLAVSNNDLSTIPASWFEKPNYLRHVELGDNPFDCTCNIESLQDWVLSDTQIYLNPHQSYLCKSPKSRENIGFADFDLDCKSHLHTYVCVVVLCALGMCIIGAVICKYRWHIEYKLFIILHKRRYLQRRSVNDAASEMIDLDIEDEDKYNDAPIHHRRYHAYVAYHKDDEQWVETELIPNIEEGPDPFRLCIKERGDIPPGRFLLSSICHGIHQSRKTIIVLSESFMKDGMCDFQLHIARTRLIKEAQDVLVLVLLQELPDDKMTLLLRQIRCHKEGLRWPADRMGQSLFWERLRIELRMSVIVDRRYEAV